MPNFRTRYDLHEPIFANPGSRVKDVLTPQFDRDGNFELVKTGEDNLYDYIQSYKESTDIHVILQRYANGDVAALSKRQGMYADFTQMPTTFAEMLNAMIQGEHYFDRLPIEVKQKFDNSFSKWMASMDDLPAFMEKMGMQVEESAESVEKEVSADES